MVVLGTVRLVRVRIRVRECLRVCGADLGTVRLFTRQVPQQRRLAHKVHDPNAAVAHPLHKRPNQQSRHLIER